MPDFNEVPDVPVSEPTPIFGRIAWHFENTLMRSFKRAFNSISNNILILISSSFMHFLELIESELVDSVNPLLEQLLNTPGMPDEIKATIREVQSKSRPAAAIIIVPILMAGFGALISGPTGVLSRLSAYETEKFAHTARLNPPEAIMALRRGLVGDGLVRTHLIDLGWTEELIDVWEGLTVNLLEIPELASGVYRGIINEAQFRETLQHKGYQQQDVNTLWTLIQRIPGPSDLVRMAVREAWNEGVSRRFGYDDDFPPEFAEWMTKQGLGGDWAKRYWRAHWELPGVRDAFTMLHRRIITQDDMADLLRAKDISSFWRDGLIKLSYNPYTRVDVRRMYASGVVTEQEVFDTYLDLGYDNERARKLTDWTIKEYQAEGRELTKSDVLGAYIDGTVTGSEAQIYLEAIDYAPQEIAVLLARADLKKLQAYEKEVVNNVRVAFVGMAMNEQDVYVELGRLNPPAGFVEDRLAIWRIQRARALKKPTVNQLRDFWIEGVINQDELRSELKKHRFNDMYIDMFITFWTIKFASD